MVSLLDQELHRKTYSPRWRAADPIQGPPFVRLSGAVTRYNAMDVQRWLLSRRIDPQEQSR
ncbi:hypothetical protein GCM10009736_71110 [Actinomadura bangladeshensis]|uniref:Uncharacterized protein n=1 Tax=Actinomadura bangladeshensis TaxID=453573 RepID=A0A4R4PAF7_9ACTN|nr:hypothetical protein E1284_09950 [Actinomadura bangladeshensis]